MDIGPLAVVDSKSHKLMQYGMIQDVLWSTNDRLLVEANLGSDRV
jgi:hypothetical protein